MINFHNRRAYLYERRSVEDQSQYSIIDQDERLKAFCKIFNIKIVAVFQDDDYSAKTFVRPAYKQMTERAKVRKGEADILLFTNWSRFSRSKEIGDTYFQIANLARLGIEIQAIEQQVDLDIPENHHLLSIYITSPMVENLRRASNVRYGMRRALKSGHWEHLAPYGYTNGRDELNKPLLKIMPQRAQIIHDIFTQYLSGRDPKLIMREAWKKGLTVRSHSAFQRVITNPIYAGLIRVPLWKDEPEQIIKGVHEPIIEEDLFHAVQNKFRYGNRTKARIYSEELPLRGLLCCNNCGNAFTGGRSKGKGGGYWFYYRCLHCNGENYSIKKVHTELEEILSAISLTQPQIEFFIATVDSEMKQLIKQNSNEAERLSKEIKEYEEKLSSLEEKYISGKLDFETYQKYYPVYRGAIAEKWLRLESLSTDKNEMIELYRAALPKMTNLAFLYDECGLEDKQTLIRLVFIGGLYKLRNGSYRTLELCPLFDAKAAQDKGLVIGEKVFINTASRVVQAMGTQSNHIELLLRFVLKVAA